MWKDIFPIINTLGVCSSYLIPHISSEVGKLLAQSHMLIFYFIFMVIVIVNIKL